MLKFNDFNLKIIYPEKKSIIYEAPSNQPSPLNYEINANPIIRKEGEGTRLITDENNLINYNLYGQQTNRVTQHTNLHQKIKDIDKQPLSFHQEDNEDEVQTEAKFPRYFDDVNTIEVVQQGVCRRCKMPGHFERMCTEDPANEQRGIVCKYCLGDHFHLRCPNTVCYKCNGFGHMAKNCDKEQSFNRCHLCGKKGHLKKECGFLSENFNITEEDPSIFKKVSCLVCLKKGHLNCLDYQDRVDDDIFGFTHNFSKQKHKKQKFLRWEEWNQDSELEEIERWDKNREKQDKIHQKKKEKKKLKLLEMQQNDSDYLEQHENIFIKLNKKKEKKSDKSTTSTIKTYFNKKKSNQKKNEISNFQINKNWEEKKKKIKK